MQSKLHKTRLHYTLWHLYSWPINGDHTWMCIYCAIRRHSIKALATAEWCSVKLAGFPYKTCMAWAVRGPGGREEVFLGKYGTKRMCFLCLSAHIACFIYSRRFRRLVLVRTHWRQLDIFHLMLSFCIEASFCLRVRKKRVFMTLFLHNFNFISHKCEFIHHHSVSSKDALN